MDDDHQAGAGGMLIGATTLWNVALIIVAAVLAALGLLLSRRVVPDERIQGHNEAAGFIFATLGVIYAVLIAFVVIVVWESFVHAQDIVGEEAGVLVALYRGANAFAEPQRSAVQTAIRAYTEQVIEDEWRTMARGERGQQTERAMEVLWGQYRTLPVQSPWEVAVASESFSQVNQLSILRTRRLTASRESLPRAFWLVLLGGGVITVVFSYFLHTRNVLAHAIMSALLAALIAATLFLVVAFDRPFVGDVSVQPEAYREALELFERSHN